MHNKSIQWSFSLIALSVLSTEAFRGRHLTAVVGGDEMAIVGKTFKVVRRGSSSAACWRDETTLLRDVISSKKRRRRRRRRLASPHSRPPPTPPQIACSSLTVPRGDTRQIRKFAAAAVRRRFQQQLAAIPHHRPPVRRACDHHADDAFCSYIRRVAKIVPRRVQSETFIETYSL